MGSKMRIIVGLMGLLFLTGCAKLQHLDQLLTLKAVSDEQARMDQTVERQNQKFQELIKAVQDGSVKNYPDQKSIAKKFGEPILKRETNKEGQTLEYWLYRYATKYFDSEKIYLYFDHEAKLISSEYVPAGKFSDTAEKSQ